MKTCLSSIFRQMVATRVTFSVGALVLLSCLTYFNTLDNTFHIDDFSRIVNNPGIRTIQPVTRHFMDPLTMSIKPELVHFRPLVPLSFSFNYVFWNNSLPSYHGVNIAFHTASAIVIFLLCLELLRQASLWEYLPRYCHGLSLFVAAIFAVHPVSGISINYITNRDLLMMEFFLLVSFLLYVRMRRGEDSWVSWLAILVLFSLSLLSKQNAVVFPLLILVYEWTVNRSPFLTQSSWLRAMPFAFLVIGLFFYTRYVLEFSTIGKLLPGKIDSFWDYPLLQFKIHISHYLANFFWPVSIRMGPYIEPVSPSDLGPWLGLAFIASTLYLAYWLRIRSPLSAFCILAYWITLSPTSSVLPIFVLAAHYRPYPSSFFFYLLMGMVMFQTLPRKVLAGICVLLVIYFASVSIYLNSTWKTETTLWQHSIDQDGSKKNPVNLLNYAMNVDDLDVREEYLRKTLELSPRYHLGKIDLGLTLIHKGQKEEGLKIVKEAVELNPGLAQSHYWLGIAYKLTGQYEQALMEVETAASIDSGQVEVLYDLALLKQLAGKYSESIPVLQKVRERAPDFRRLGFLLGFAYQSTGLNDLAVKTYSTYLEKRPNDFQARFNLGYAQMVREEYSEAVESFHMVLDFKPDYYEVHLHLSTCYKKLGNDSQSQDHLKIWEQKRSG